MVSILHIDDNETDRLVVKRELGRVFPGLLAREARNQEEFERALDAGGFDIAITDYQLLWTNGLVALNTIKARYPDCPVVMFTGTGNEEIAVEAMKEGLDDYVVKSPQHAIRLVTAVRSALEKADARRRAAEAEHQRARLLRSEQAARAEAERLLGEAKEADRKKDEFLAMLAHELRNPLSPILNAVHMLKQPGLRSEDLERMREMLVRQVKHLARLVDDLLDVSRITRGKVQLRRQRVNLAHLVRDTTEDHRAALEGNGLALDLVLPAEPVWVAGDNVRLSQVLGNLLQNSAKFTERGGRVAVRLGVEAASQHALLQVEDTGIGIDGELLPRVFEMFTQADQSLDRSRGGLGLGLALVKGLTELHGGQASAASPGTGQGAVFTIRLPLAVDMPADPEAAAGGTEIAAPLGVLVIEDHRDGAESLRMMLELFGHEVRVAHTGQAGIEIAREFQPAVILCDLGLAGGMSGYDVARSLRQDPALAGVRLVAVSGYGQPEDKARAQAAGFDFHFTKPVDPVELQRRLG